MFSLCKGQISRLPIITYYRMKNIYSYKYVLTFALVYWHLLTAHQGGPLALLQYWFYLQVLESFEMQFVDYVGAPVMHFFICIFNQICIEYRTWQNVFATWFTLTSTSLKWLINAEGGKLAVKMRWKNFLNSLGVFCAFISQLTLQPRCFLL